MTCLKSYSLMICSRMLSPALKCSAQIGFAMINSSRFMHVVMSEWAIPVRSNICL